MRRRGAHDNPVNLFSFQDVMTSVIGILFFVVTLMALDIVNRQTAQATPTEEASRRQLDELARDHEQACAEVTRLKASGARAVDRMELVTASEESVRSGIEQMDRRLATLHESLRQKVAIQQQSAKSQIERETTAQKIAEDSQRLKESIDALKERLKRRQSSPRVTYIIDPVQNSLEPWLVEVTNSHIRIAAKDGRSAVMSFLDSDGEARKKQFMKWAAGQSNRSHYFVLLIKPSGVAEAEEISESLSKSGYHIGSDLLPESWSPFD